MSTIEQSDTSDVYAAFCGAINEENVKMLIGCLTAATVKKKNVHLLFQSSGGSVGDGICLYSFFKTLPVGLTIYNVGSIGSIAVIAYLGGNRRITSPRAVFMIHRSTIKSTGHLPLTVMKGIVRSLTLDDERIECILKDQIVLPVGQEWSHLDDYDFFFSGKEAVEIGLAHELGEFSPPAGTSVYQFFSNEKPTP
jgi:ATP-dependent protease ClpP protease subunit